MAVVGSPAASVLPRLLASKYATDILATLRISSNGSLELVDGKQSSVWSANISNCSSAFLLDEGNFVVKDAVGADLWESFDDGSDSLLPSMLLGYDSASGKQNFLTCWKSKRGPSSGIFLVGLSVELSTQAFIWINGSTTHRRSGPWDKSKFIGAPNSNPQYLNAFTVVDNEAQGTRYFSYSFEMAPTEKSLSYMDISSEGVLSIVRSESGKNWSVDWVSSENQCDNYGTCGPFGVCKAYDSPICKCLKGFIPKSNEEWSKKQKKKQKLDCRLCETYKFVLCYIHK